MNAEFKNGNVIANCPDCGGARTTFEPRDANREFGYVVLESTHPYNGKTYSRVIYSLMRCAGCGRGGVAKIHATGIVREGALEEFFPFSVDRASVPSS